MSSDKTVQVQSSGTPTQSPSLRARKKDKTRRALLETADRLFRDKGYEATTLEEICERSGISLRTFFRYFESKRDLALFENLRNVARLREGLARARTRADVLDELEGLYDFMAIEFENDTLAQDRLKLMLNEPSLVAHSLLLDVETEARIVHALDNPDDRDDAFAMRMLATMLVGGIRHVLSGWVHRGCKGPLRENIARVFAVARKTGLAPQTDATPGRRKGAQRHA